MLGVLLIFLFLSLIGSLCAAAEDGKTVLFHLKTGLKHDDAQICVAYNMIWAALDDGMDVDVLIDADAVNTFKVGWRSKDSIEDFALPERLRRSLSEQFGVELLKVPKNYGAFLNMLHDNGAKFHVNSAFLVLAKIETEMGKTENISPKFFRPVTLKEMLALLTDADYYMVY